jgi:hypothetical protein
VLTPTDPAVDMAVQVKLGSKLLIAKLNPLIVEVTGPRFGGTPVPVLALPVVEPVPFEKPVRIALMVIVASAPGLNPETVINPEELRLALPALVL